MIFLIKNVTILSEYICTKVSQIGFDVTIEMAFVNLYGACVKEMCIYVRQPKEDERKDK